MILSAVRHLEALRTSGMLTESFRRMYRPGAAMVRPQKVIRILKEAGVRFVVMGTHGISGYRDMARATQDVDVLIRSGDHRKAVAAVQKGYPRLVALDTPAVTRFKDPATDKVVIDLMKPLERLYRLTFKNVLSVGNSYLIPNLEMALTCKFAAMISPNRSPDKKHTDAADFINMVRHNEAIDLTRLKKLGEVVYRGGGREILQYVKDAKAGRTLQV